MNLSSNLTLELFDKPFLLEKRIALLLAIDEQGSISKAAKSVPMSYKSAWDAVDAMNNLSHTPIVLRETGGKGGGGTALTAYGKNLLKTYHVLKEQQERFLQTLQNLTDLDSGTFKTIGRLAMQLSAHNQISGIVEKIVLNDVNANVLILPKSGQVLFANISKEAVLSLGLEKGAEVVAIFRANNVLLATDENIAISARNKLAGEIVRITTNSTNAEVVIKTAKEEHLSANVTAGAIKRLGLCEGSKVFAFIKSSDIMVGR